MWLALAVIVGCGGLVVAYLESRGLSGDSSELRGKRVRRLRTSLRIWTALTVVVSAFTALLLIATAWLIAAVFALSALIGLSVVLYLRRRLKDETRTQ